MPKESESRVEQSFNEQLFARILGYRTLLSHDALPYNLRPKNYAAGSRRYDDFSLGTFWGDERGSVCATAEFKDPGIDLDAPQTDRRDKRSPVEQAFQAAAGFPSCRWVIVSNFRDLRLYGVDDQAKPIVTLDLHEIRTPRQLAVLAAHFDHEALIGAGVRSGMAAALDPNHPSVPIGAVENSFRVVCTFTPRGAVDLPLYSVYDAVRETAVDKLRVKRDPWDRTSLVPEIDDGWVSVDVDNVRLAMSAEGQVRYSIRHPRTCGPEQINPDAGFFQIAGNLHDFMLIVERLLAAVERAVSGILSFELREIREWRIYFDGSSELLKKDDDTNFGIADKNEILSSDVFWGEGRDSGQVAADCMGELALQFKSPQGSRVRFEHTALAKHFRAKE